MSKTTTRNRCKKVQAVMDKTEKCTQAKNRAKKYGMINWLKSLKERYTWKPSDEQMKALWDSIPENVKEISEREMLLDSLYQDLKKLRKE